MAKPIVAVVGRPNVGKSTLFNKLIGQRLSIVDDTPGVTRDRIFGDCEWRGKSVTLIDTGGIEPKTDDIILSQMRAQATLAIDMAQVIIFVVDMKSGVTAADEEVGAMLQKSGKPVVLCVNKCDGIGETPPEFYEFYNLGLGDPVAVSSVHGHGTGDLLDAVYEHIDFAESEEADEEKECVSVAIIGKPNAGKSSLINDTLQRILAKHFYRALREPLPYERIEGIEYIDKIVDVDQSPLGRTPRSNPATYTGVFADIRNLFVDLPEAKIRGYKPGRFSFNVSGGRCDACSGNGYKTLEMNFLPDVMVPCEVCRGKRYNRETLEVRYKGKSIADVLDMTINMAVDFFENVPTILNKIKVLQDVGLGYIKLGQPSTTLSGGESQRVKLATELSKRDTGKTLYLLDEPTTGLHFEDIRVLMEVVNRLVDKGNTVIIIEHNLDVIKMADYIIDLGPEGGRDGGQVVATGTPEEVAAKGEGYTAPYIARELER